MIAQASAVEVLPPGTIFGEDGTPSRQKLGEKLTGPPLGMEASRPAADT
jgi:hypothetical protein